MCSFGLLNGTFGQKVAALDEQIVLAASMIDVWRRGLVLQSQRTANPVLPQHESVDAVLQYDTTDGTVLGLGHNTTDGTSRHAASGGRGGLGLEASPSDCRARLSVVLRQTDALWSEVQPRISSTIDRAEVVAEIENSIKVSRDELAVCWLKIGG